MRLAGGTASHQLPSRGNTTPRTTGDGADRAHGTIRVSTSPGRALADGYFRLASQRGPLPGHQFDQSRWRFAAADLAHVFVDDFVEIRGGYVERFQLLETVGIVLCIRQARNADSLVDFMRKINVHIQLLPELGVQCRYHDLPPDELRQDRVHFGI